VMQAQNGDAQLETMSAFDWLPQEKRSTIINEMSLTGCEGQQYEGVNLPPTGPAFLVYYWPAVLRYCAQERSAGAALCFLAEVFRAARLLWPACLSDSGRSVTLLVGQLKELTPYAIAEGHSHGSCWVLVRQTRSSGVVEKWQISELIALDPARRQCIQLLRFWNDPDLAASKEFDANRAVATSSTTCHAPTWAPLRKRASREQVDGPAPRSPCKRASQSLQEVTHLAMSRSKRNIEPLEA